MDMYRKIDEILKQKNMSRRQLAIAAEIPESTLAAAFARKSARFSPVYLYRIAKVLGVSVDKLDPRIAVERAMDTIIHKTEEDHQEQIEHHALVLLLRDEFVTDGVLESINDDAMRNDLYTIIAAANALNKEGREKAIDYLFDLNKIYQYRYEQAKFSKELLRHKMQEGE